MRCNNQLYGPYHYIHTTLCACDEITADEICSSSSEDRIKIIELLMCSWNTSDERLWKTVFYHCDLESVLRIINTYVDNTLKNVEFNLLKDCVSRALIRHILNYSAEGTRKCLKLNDYLRKYSDYNPELTITTKGSGNPLVIKLFLDYGVIFKYPAQYINHLCQRRWRSSCELLKFWLEKYPNHLDTIICDAASHKRRDIIFSLANKFENINSIELLKLLSQYDKVKFIAPVINKLSGIYRSKVLLHILHYNQHTR